MDPFPQAHPPTKIGYFYKNVKIISNITICASTVFYKKGVNFPKKIFGQNKVIFTRGDQVKYTCLVWSLTLIIDDKQQKTIRNL